QQRDVVWLFVEVSRDAFTGPLGQAGIDQSIEAAVRLAEGHLARGDVVGLQLVGSKSTSRVPLGRGPRHAAQLISLLSLDAHCAHAERSDWDEREVARRVLEHLRGLDHRASHLAAGDTNGLARLAALTLERAPVQPKRPRATSALDGLLREYLLAFGIHPPAQTASD